MTMIYGVSQVTGYLSDLLAYDDLLNDIWIEGEVFNMTRSGAGHSYFTLRDSKGALRCVLFRSGRGGQHLSAGAQVVAHGRIGIHEPRGDLQLIADIIQPEGVGELQLRLEELRMRLSGEGLFDQSRKRPLPAFPRRVGVVTSPTGSVWHDIQNVLSRRYPLVELLLAPAMVQGDTAADTIVEALAALNEEPDVDAVIVARGGGSLEDLWPFNEEAVARAVFASRAPVVSAIGHETDTTICDLVADLRAPTPSAAAELVAPDRDELAMRVEGAARAIHAAASRHVERASADLDARRQRLDRAAPSADELRIRVDETLDRAVELMERGIERHRSRVAAALPALRALSPTDTLRRGYAIVVDSASGAVLTDPADTAPGRRIDITLHKGDIVSTVQSTSAAVKNAPED